MWNVNSTSPMYALTGHQLGVNCVNFHRGEKPYLLSGGDDKLIKVWDYMLRSCIHTLDAHQNNISSVLFHPDLPLIFSAAEDGAVMIWHSSTYKLQTTLDYFMERAWCLDYCQENTNIVAIGFDEGVMVLKIGNDEPLASLNNGKLIVAKNTEVLTANLKALNFKDEALAKEGAVIPVPLKEMGNWEIYPQKIRHSPKGHLYAVISDSEYYIYKVQTFKNIALGQGTDLVWSPSEGYAVRELNVVRSYNASNTQVSSMVLDFNAEGLFGGNLLCVKASNFVVFYHWETMKCLRKIEASAKRVLWNDGNTKVLIATANSFFVLEYNKKYVDEVIESLNHEDGLENAFEVLYEIHDSLTSAIFVHDVVIYTNDSWKISFAQNGKHFYLAFPDKKKMYLVGYVNTQERYYLIDKHNEVVSYTFPVSFAQLLSVSREEYPAMASKLLGKIPQTYYDKLAKYLEAIDMKREAFEVAQDLDLKYSFD
jgi:coatomer subunit beta'